MSDPIGGTTAPYTSDVDLFAKIGADIPDEETPTPAGGEGAPEAPVPAEPAKAPETPATPAEPAAPAVARDDKGRFTKPTAEPAAAPPATEPAAPAPSAAAAAPAATPAAPDLSQFPAYEYEAAGRKYPLAGAIRGSEGVLIRNEGLPQFEQLLATAQQVHARESAWGRERVGLQGQIKAATDEKNFVLGEMFKVLQLPDEEFYAWATDRRGEAWEKWDLQARLQIAERDRDERGEVLDEAAREREVQALIPQLHTAVERTVQQLAGTDEFKDLALDPAWQKEFKERLLETHFDRMFSEADEAAVTRGLARQVGETLFDPQPILAEMRYQAGVVRRELARNRALADAAARNAATAPTAVTPPVTGGKPAQVPAGTPKPRLHEGMSRAEVDKVVFGNIDEEE